MRREANEPEVDQDRRPCHHRPAGADHAGGADHSHAVSVGVFLRMTAIRFDGLWGLPGPDRRIVAGATRPRTPRFTFGRPKVNRKTAKTHGFGFLFLISL